MPGDQIVTLRPVHAHGVLAAYADGIATGRATFETAVPTWTEWDSARLADHRFVALAADHTDDPDAARTPAVLGWVAVSPTSRRAAYAGVVELGIYVAAAARGRGVGAALLGRLVDSCDTGGIWTIQAGVFPENEASLALHARFGFRRVGVRERIGRLDGRWRDVVLLERRSAVVG